MNDTLSFLYDAALSFLQGDEHIAQAIADGLRQTCSVFVYSERQRELAGKDGVDEFTTVFRDKARVCVVLYREGWGATKWTRVEETAIKDRAFDTGWDFLTVVALGPVAPKWLPRTKLWLGYERFGVQGAVAVIEARVRELGGEAVVETARAKAERLAKAAAAREERDAFLNSEQGVAAAKQAIAELREYLRGEVEAMRAQTPPVDIVFDHNTHHDVFGVSTSRSAVTFGWSLQYSNTLRHSSLLIQEFDRAYRIGGFSTRRRVPVASDTWLFTRAMDGGFGWHEKHEPERIFSTSGLAEHLLGRVLERAHKRAHEPRSDGFDDE